MNQYPQAWKLRISFPFEDNVILQLTNAGKNSASNRVIQKCFCLITEEAEKNFRCNVIDAVDYIKINLYQIFLIMPEKE